MLASLRNVARLPGVGGALPLSRRLMATATQIMKDKQHISVHSPIFQVYGANTDVGKTLVSAGLVRSALATGGRVAYIKPMQTGDVKDAEFVRKHAAHTPDAHMRLHTSTLYQWIVPASPHLSAALEDRVVPDSDVIDSVRAALCDLQYNDEGKVSAPFTLVETAGGVNSPGAALTPQSEVYRSLRLPVLLVGDPKLGGISATLSALDSLVMRGYDVYAIAFVGGESNKEAVEKLTAQRNIAVLQLPEAPPLPAPLDGWFANESTAQGFETLRTALNTRHQVEIARLEMLRSEGPGMVWWPFTQHKNQTGTTLIDSAYGDNFTTVADGKRVELFDACSSWWTQGVGHGNPDMAAAVAYAQGRYGHVLFPDNLHEPAIRLSQQLLEGAGSGWAKRVFFSDNGSTATEVAIKMAFRKFIKDHNLPVAPKLRVLGQTDCYHGDTLGAMDVAAPSVFNDSQHPWFESKSLLVDPPSVSCVNGEWEVTVPNSMVGESAQDARVACFHSRSDIFDLARDSSPLATLYRNYVKGTLDKADRESHEAGRIGALMIEPLIIGAGGMVFVDPLFQRILAQSCRERRIPVVYDEIFVGMFRLGVESTKDMLHFDPDISCYAKLLTGGTVPMAVTLTTEAVFESFLGDSKAEALLHGHSYTAHPIGCAASVAALDIYRRAPGYDAATKRMGEYWSEAETVEISRLPGVKRAFSLGTVLAVELSAARSGYASTAATTVVAELREKGVFVRPLGNVIYLMCSPITEARTCSEWLGTLREVLVAHGERGMSDGNVRVLEVLP